MVLCEGDGRPTLTWGACYIKSWYLTTSLPGRVHLGNVTNVVFINKFGLKKLLLENILTKSWSNPHSKLRINQYRGLDIQQFSKLTLIKPLVNCPE